MTPRTSESGIKISEVRIANFRALKNVSITLDDLTILVGANNAGKTSFLDAMYAAMGAGRKLLGPEDIYISPEEARPPKDRSILIDIIVRPVNDKGETAQHFPEGSFWTNLWGLGISQDEHFNDFVAFRTTLAWNPSQAEYTLSRKFLKEWLAFPDWIDAEQKDGVAAYQIEPIALHYIDAKRDLEDELRRPGSFWRRLTDDLGLAEADIEAFEDTLSHLNEAILDKSEVLKHLRDTLRDLQSVVSAEKSGLDIAPVARRLRDLSKGVDVTFSTTASPAFPLSRHGMGTRSLASLLVFRAFVSWKNSQAKQAGDHIHPFLALEEPEAHLHPQAQRALFSQVKAIPGQRIVSTHSAYFAGQAALEELRLFTKSHGDTLVSQLDLSSLNPDDRRKLDRMVIATRGDLLFSRALILFEGETEEQAFPLWAQAYWASSVHELGFSFVGIGGEHYFPFVWLANSLGIGWYIFSDGETRAVTRLEAELKRAGITKTSKSSNIVILPSGNNFETQLLADGYQPELEKVLDDANGAGFLAEYIKTLHGQLGKRREGVQTKRDYSGAEGKRRAILDALSESKTALAPLIAAAISECADPARRIPPQVSGLFKTISHDFGLKKAGKTP